MSANLDLARSIHAERLAEERGEAVSHQDVETLRRLNAVASEE